MSFKTIDELGLSETYCKNCSNDSEVKNVWSFFQRFEKDSDPSDLTVAEESYFNNFLFCDPSNANSVIKEDFLKFLPAMSVKYKELGFKEKKVKEVIVIGLNENYLIANVNWSMKFRKNEKMREIDDVKATYILKNEEDGYKIIFQLDNQNLEDLVQKKTC